MAQLLVARTYQMGYSPLVNDVIQADNGDYLLVGRLIDQNSNSAAFALRVRTDGSIVWENSYSSAFSVFFQSGVQIAADDFVATGSFFYSEMAGDEYLWLVKLDAAGNKLWEKALGSRDEQNDGYDIAATADGGFIVTGLILEKETGATFTWVLKFDAAGGLQWERKYAGGIAYAVAQTADGGYILSGAAHLPESLNSNVYLLRLAANGAKVWERVYPEFEIYIPLDSGITETWEGHFAVAAKSVLMEVDSCGNIVWARQNADLNLNSVARTPDGAYAVGGGLIVNFFDHAYAAVIDQTGEKILWDNTEILYNSGLARILVNRDGNVTGGGFAPLNDNRNLIFLTVFNPVQNL